MKDIRPNFMKKTGVMMSAMGIVLTAFFMFHVPAHSLTLAINVQPNQVNNNMSISVGRVAYIDQPAQAMYSLQNPQVVPYSNTTNNQTAVINSGYLTLISNSTTSATTGFSAFNLTKTITNSEGNVSFLYLSERLAFNGTGETNYMILGQNNTTSSTAPTSGAFAYFEYGSSGASFVFNNTTATVTTPVKVPSGSSYANPSALQFYTATIEVVGNTSTASGAIQFTLEQNGKLLNNTLIHTNTSELAKYIPTMDKSGGNLFLDNIMNASSTSHGNALLMDYFYFLDHYTYSGSTVSPTIQTDAIVSNAVQNVNAGAIVNFDPSVSSVNETANATVNYSAPANTAGTGSYSSLLNSSSNQSRIASDFNATDTVTNITLAQNYTFLQNGISTTRNGVINATQEVTTLRAQGDQTTHAYASYIVNGWNTSTIASSLQNDIAHTVNVTKHIPLSHIQVVSYLITNVAVETNFSQPLVNSIDTSFYNEVPSLLKANNLSLVNTSTGAVQAGSNVGMFYNFATGDVANPVVVNGMIENPFNMQKFATPELAGFPTGSVVTSYTNINGGQSAIVAVSQFNVVNGQYSFNDQHLYDSMSLFHYQPTADSIFGGLTSAGSAISNFFHAGSSSVSNAVSTLKNINANDLKIINTNVGSTVKAVTSNVNNFEKQASNDLNNIIPAVGGVATNLKNTFSSSIGSLSKTLTTGVGTIKSQLGSVTKEMQGSIASGIGTVKTKIYNLGNSLASAKDSIINTLGTKLNDTEAVLSPMFASVKNLPTELKTMSNNIYASISSQVSNELSKGMASLDSIGQTIESKTINGVTKVVSSADSFGSMTSGFLGNAGQFLHNVAGGLGGVVSWFENIAKIVGHYLIPALIIVLIIAIAIIFLIIYFRFRGAKGLFKRYTGRSGRMNRLRAMSKMMSVKPLNIGRNPNLNFYGDMNGSNIGS